MKAQAWAPPLAVALLLACVTGLHASPAFDAAKLCRTGISKQGQKYAHKRRVLVLNCIDRLLKCEVLREVDALNTSTCRSKAESSCKNTIGTAADTPLNRAADRFDLYAALACAGADFTTGIMDNTAISLWYTNDADCGASADLPSLIDCLREQLAEQVDEQIGTLKPRGGLMLDNIGLGAGFPDIPRPPLMDVIVSATAPGSGTLVNPGTISPAAGTAVRFSGDDGGDGPGGVASTLSCGGMGNNGRLTVKVLTLGSACNDSGALIQEFQVKEPYGLSDTATVGPYAVDVTYCLSLKDGSCSDEVTETIDVP